MNASATAAHSICGTSATLPRTAAIVSSSGGCIEKNHTQTDKKMCQLSRDHLLLIELLCRAGFEFTQCCVYSSSLRIHLGIPCQFKHRGRKHGEQKEEREGMGIWDKKHGSISRLVNETLSYDAACSCSTRLTSLSLSCRS